jgi:hypothetical protein
MRASFCLIGAASLLAAGSAPAQNPAEPSVAPQARPIVGGKDLQPRLEAPPDNPTTPDAQRLLDEYKPAVPPPPPHDLYGKAFAPPPDNSTDVSPPPP